MTSGLGTASASTISNSCSPSGQAVGPAALRHNHVHEFRQLQNGFQELKAEEFGYALGDPDDQPKRAAEHAALERLFQFFADRKNLVGIAEDLLAGFREHEIPAHAVEQLHAQVPFELAQLSADRGRRQPKLLAGSRDAPLTGDSPEIQQMMVIQPTHASHNTSDCPMFQLDLSFCPE